MRSFFGYLVSITLLALCILLIMYIFIPSHVGQSKYLSPLPDFLTVGVNKQVTLLDFWSPIVEKFQAEASPPTFTARAVLLYNLSTNKSMYSYQSSKRLPMASLTKIMTAIVALENKRHDDRYVVRAENLVGEDSMGVLPGEIFSLEELLYGLMLPSGNDAAEVIASNYVGGRKAFIDAMNDKVKAMGLDDTHFSNPSGLQGDGQQYTTALDLLVITKYALDNFPVFRKIVSTYEHTLPATGTHQSYTLYNETNLLTTYPGVKGVKTGYTPEAGMCLITLLEYKGHSIVGILLNSENRREEMKHFLDFSLLSLKITPPSHQ